MTIDGCLSRTGPRRPPESARAQGYRALGRQVRLRRDHHHAQRCFRRAIRPLHRIQNPPVGLEGGSDAERAQHSSELPPHAQLHWLLALLPQHGERVKPPEHRGEHALEAQRGHLALVVVRLERQERPFPLHALQMDVQLSLTAPPSTFQLETLSY